MRDYWSFFSAQHLVFGRNSSSHLGAFLRERGVRRAVIITDQTLVRLGFAERVQHSIAEAGGDSLVFDGGEPEPSIETAERAYEFVQGHEVDGVIGLGGGSNMDLAKILAILLGHGGHPRDYFHFNQVPGPVCPLICVPTTAGTGSEVSHAAVLTDRETGLKMSTLSPHLRPALAVVDPGLTDECPAQVTADSGIDALTHAIEGFVARDFASIEVPNAESIPYSGSHPLGDVMAEKAIRLVGEHLAEAVLHPGNKEARDGMALAATLAGLAFSNCAVAVVHALEYPMGVELHCSHGAGNGLLLPYVMDYNFDEAYSKFARVFEWLGGDSTGMDERTAGRQAIEKIIELRQRIGIPHRIRDLGGKEEQLAGFASKAFGIKRLMDLNPRTPTEEGLLEILRKAY